MIKFSIIIPFRPKAQSVDWENECLLLQKTILSVLQQSYQNFKILVIYTDLPIDFIVDDKVIYIHFQYGFQPYEEIINNDLLFSYFKSKILVVRRWDKARKVMYGIKIAKELNCDYSMILDADDHISKYLLNYMAIESELYECPGWYIDQGFVYKNSDSYLIRIPNKMNYLNGSTHVLQNKFISIPDFTSQEWQKYNIFTDHGWIKDRVKQEFNIELRKIPFPAVVYFVHSSNVSNIRNKEYRISIKTVLKRLLRGIRLTESLRSEFFIFD